MKQVPTPSQTVGPFFRIGLDARCEAPFAGPQVMGERVQIAGSVLDGDRKPVPDAMLEVWQADASGNYASAETSLRQGQAPRFRGWGRILTNDHGKFHFTTIRPGAVPGPDGTKQAPHLQAPHLVVSIFMRGLLKHLVSRIYFAGEPANQFDPILALVDPARRHTLEARPDSTVPGLLRWDIHLQGEQETVFFDC
jgi:protocatechuate 3,4-dioxygenase alpha subunit